MDEEQIAQRRGIPLARVRLLLIVRRNLIMSLGLFEDYLGVRRTIPPRKKRKAQRWFEEGNGRPIHRVE